MGTGAMLTEDLSRSASHALLGRSSLILAVVAAAHGVLLALLLRTSVPAPLVEALMPRPAGDGGQRLEVVLLEPTPPEVMPPAMTPPEIVTPTMRDLPSPPTIEIEPKGPSTDERLQGLYLGQVRARIDRAWEALSARQAPALPDCTIHVTQDLRGQVLDVAVEDCAVDDVERAQISRVVRAAAPLPAPPAGLRFQPQVEFRLTVGR